MLGNSFLVREIYIPSNEVDPVYGSEASVQVKVVFQMPKEALYPVSGFRNAGVLQVVEHVGIARFMV